VTMGSRALVTMFFGGMLTLPSMCNVYKTDVGKLCDAEQLSQSSLKGNKSQLFTWMERNAASAEAVILVRNLESKDTRGFGLLLRDEARKQGFTACALADQADMQAKDEAYKTDMQNLCNGSAPRSDGSVARLDILSADDAERMREMVAWSSSNGSSPDMATFVSKLAGAPPRQRGALLRAEATNVGVTSCLRASTLETPPPAPPGPVDTHVVFPNFTLMKVDGPSKNQSLIALKLTEPAAGAAINACYALALENKASLTGKVAVRITLDSSGTITRASDDGSTVKGSLLPCVEAAVHGISLGTALPEGGRKGAHATVTMLFTPSTVGPGYSATVDPTWLSKAQPRRR
jgi:hypothetical protein